MLVGSQEELPNIRGDLWIGSVGHFSIGSRKINNAPSALNPTDSTNCLSGMASPSVQTETRGVSLDASQYNEIYKDDAHVEPGHLVFKCWLRLA